MKTLHFIFDPLSPDARRAFDELPQWLEGVHHEVIHEPALVSATSGLALLRLAFACSVPGRMPSRWVIENILRHAAQAGDPDDAQRLSVLAQALKPGRDPQSPEVEAEVQAAQANGIAHGLTPEPIVEVDGRRFVGGVGLPLMSAWLRGA
jgi:hypothetical protein